MLQILSALREVKVVKENIFKVKLLQDSSIDPSLAVTEDSVKFQTFRSTMSMLICQNHVHPDMFIHSVVYLA